MHCLAGCTAWLAALPGWLHCLAGCTAWLAGARARSRGSSQSEVRIFVSRQQNREYRSWNDSKGIAGKGLTVDPKLF
jgi:hypothetical protein